jgi:regulatory protein
LTGPRRAREPKNPLPLHERALGLLAVRPRSRSELRSRLIGAGFEPDEVAQEMDRLQGVGLVDDDRFAEEFAEQAVTRRLQGRRSVAAALAAKGVDRGVIDRALAGLEGDEERAAELARSRARKLGSLAPEAAYRRLVSFLSRRGYDGAVARAAARKGLGLDGSD